MNLKQKVYNLRNDLIVLDSLVSPDSVVDSSTMEIKKKQNEKGSLCNVSDMCYTFVFCIWIPK